MKNGPSLRAHRIGDINKIYQELSFRLAPLIKFDARFVDVHFAVLRRGYKQYYDLKSMAS